MNGDSTELRERRPSSLYSCNKPNGLLTADLAWPWEPSMTRHSCHALFYITLGFPSIQAVYGQSLLLPDTSLVPLPFPLCLCYVGTLAPFVYMLPCSCVHTCTQTHTHTVLPPCVFAQYYLCLAIPWITLLLRRHISEGFSDTWTWTVSFLHCTNPMPMSLLMSNLHVEP